ncbi:AMP-binding protein [Nocardia amikacinitolerans]|uniref:AMP-binding protein n=1 Tax=Nocardia amikacinitolerans TaxID=756689 RepID=UPI0020A24014|nr:AMP-binding protein [Nocardia amikacinitolerans]MCP2281000.1 Acyl-CoA synthetase (AMP-forming)/AMP-acid ligase II [Nocardia amikacinitolerans]
MSFASPFPGVDIPDVGIFDCLFGDLGPSDLERVALIDGASSARLTYGELIERIEGFAGGLSCIGFGIGDVVGVLCPNIPAFAVAFHGILRAGATATTINVLFTAPEIAKQLQASGAKGLITVSVFLPQAKEAARLAGLTDDALIVLDGGVGHRSAVDLLALGALPPKQSFDPATHVAVLPFSSGTTGSPKGVMLTHRNLVANVCQIDSMQDIGSGDVIIAVLPFFHIYGMTVLLNAALKARARLVTMVRFELADFLAAIEKYRVTHLFIAPPVALALAKHPMIDAFDLSSVRKVVSGAAPLDQELGEAVAERLDAAVVQGFGMTELSPVSHGVPTDLGVSIAGRPAPISASGWPVANTENKLIDPATGAEIALPADGLSRPGELLVRGPNVMAGYLNNPSETAATIEPDGFLRTGDLACVDSTGCVFIVDRIKELIKYKGYQVPPAELEALLLTHPSIADAAVVAAVDDDGEEIPMAFVVTQPGAQLGEDEVIRFVADQVAPYKKVRRVAFITEIPKSAAGKILRKDLRQSVIQS